MSTRTASEVREELRHARAVERLHSAYLFEGPAGTGKREVAEWFARLLLCQERGPDPCERCGGCAKSRLDPDGGASRHADWHRLSPDGASFKIEQVRMLQRALSLTPQEGGHRVGLLLRAEALTVAAANALLKTLEEPPPRTALLLVARSGDTLPSTIRSRSVRLRFRPTPADQIVAELERQGLGPRDAWLAAQLGGGSPAAAAAWAADHLEAARELWSQLEAVPQGSNGDLLTLAESFRGGGESVRERAELFFDVYAAFARDAIHSVLHEAPPALEQWLERADRVASARREWSRRNLNPQLVVERLLFALRA